MAMTIAHLGLMDDEDIELDFAALALSELDHTGLDLSGHARLLRDIGERLAVVGADAGTPRAQAGALAAVFHEEYGFVGDKGSYDAPLNGDMVRVLDRRQGLPISLSILYAAAARRMGWTAGVLNTPGHVLLRIGRVESVIVDPFNGGAIVSDDQLIALLQHAQSAGMAGDAGPMSNQDVLVRLLLNQAMRAEQAGDAGRAMTLYQRMTLVAPANPDGWWALARLQLAAGMIDEARRSLTAMLEITRDEGRRDLVATVLERIAAA
ncbi:MAG: tetratricopeptide repeat protein [Sphingobium sp.]|nr:tetratricopeptide repeat protein [Sphingobium sp.]